jgi:Copper type II ascorbate-dependent monooxygenase, C-terminal domain
MRFIVTTMLAGAAMVNAAPTFYKDVLPVLQRNCQSCHRAGEAAPMALITYQDARPWAKSIRDAVLSRKMPPWFADAAYGHFANDRTLAKADVDTLVGWTDSGAAAGNPKDAPKPLEFTDGWNIPKPDVILEMPADYQVPATGTIEYQHFIVPTGFTEDKWVQVVELRPGNRAVVHHAAVFVRPPESKWLRQARAGEPASGKQAQQGQGLGDELLDFHVPGSVPHALPVGQAKLIPAGSDLIFQMHYTANGKPATDRTRLGIVFAKEPPRERIYTLQIVNHGFSIPPGNPDYPVNANVTVQDSARIVALNPHMHLRGKSFEFRLVPPGGEARVLLNVPHYDFSWQLQYYLAEQLAIAPGSRIECSAHFDNSPNNRFNPDAGKEVHWGDQSWEEMMVGTVDVAIDAKMNPLDLYRPKPKAVAANGQ